jgi:hypothetical protein
VEVIHFRIVIGKVVQIKDLWDKCSAGPLLDALVLALIFYPDSRIAIRRGQNGKFLKGRATLVPKWKLLAHSGSAAEVSEKWTLQAFRDYFRFAGYSTGTKNFRTERLDEYVGDCVNSTAFPATSAFMGT